MKGFKEDVELVSSVANKKNKLSAVAETGINVDGGTLAVNGNQDKNWFSEVSEIVGNSDMSYYMVWSNDNDKKFFSPFMVSENKGHEMINEFIDYYNEENSIFADGVGAYKEISANVKDKYSYGYISSPISGLRILEPVKLTARLNGYKDNLKFVLRNNDGKIIRKINGNFENGVFTGDITKDDLNTIGKCSGTIELYSGENKLNTINAIFNIKERVRDSKNVDDFESYGDENKLLQKEWATNYGSGCYVEPMLSSQEGRIYSGGKGLEFKYKITNEKSSEGWAGITTNLNTDWSDCDSLQFWCKPDGNGQKLVIQITSNGEDFEVHLPEFAATTEPKLLTIPFSEFKGKDNGTFDSSHIDRFGIWCNTIADENSNNLVKVDSSMFFDDIKAVKFN
ncbi:MAG TPA: hypothetical protein DG753_09925 [Clostridium sp.]|nr:hypothetical protein [Clostridium sp.]